MEGGVSFGDAFGKRDYQETEGFRNYISDRLYDFLNMACGDYVESYDEMYGDFYSTDENAAAAMVEEGTLEDANEALLNEALYAIEQEAQEEKDKSGSFTTEEKSRMAARLHEEIKEDKNLLYRVSYGKDELYSNMEPDDGALLADYNFVLRFQDGKAFIEKDGKELDVYGDGIYREKDDWRLPGYQNLTGKEKWGQAVIEMKVAKEPVIYSHDDGYDFQSGELYFLYQTYEDACWQIWIRAAGICAGLLMLALYLVFRKEKGEASRMLAGVTAKMWFECKAILFLVLPGVLFAGVASRTMHDFAYAFPEYDSVYFSDYMDEYAAELSVFAQDALNGRLSFAWLLAAFWALYLFVNDLLRNKGSLRHGGFGKLASVFESANEKLPLSRKMTRQSYGALALTLAQLLFFIFFLIYVLVFRFRLNGGSAWETGAACLAALALAVLLLAAEYRYQKKIKFLSGGIERLAGRLSEIRSGGYAVPTNGEEREGEDADIRRMAEDLEGIRQGLETAVEERTGSERMKVELLANVSHDIKTPLTSIISYIKLIRQEEGLPEHVRDYVRILDEKSERLRIMVQDVFAVSKAVSGQLVVESEALDLGKLLRQTLADMEEMITGSSAVLKASIPAEPVTVWADGERMYRVFQNLIANALKYSLDGSRVYVTLESDGKTASASVKNTSSRELDQDLDFAGRFIRGDASRTDGGSGLGLSIAKSFTEACGGTFALEVIADLFVVTVSFPVCPHPGRNEE